MRDETAGSTRDAVLQVLTDVEGPLGISDVAARLDVHPNTARFHLERLVDAGRIERAPAEKQTPGRPRLLYRAIAAMDPAGPRSYDLLARVLVESLGEGPDVRRRAIAAGKSYWRHSFARDDAERALGEAGDDVERLADLLDRLGFEPQRHDDGRAVQIALRHCPFLELAQERPGVVCAIHLGLMRGALHDWKSDHAVKKLEAFATPNTCIAHLELKG